jgi:hypothetical protein
LLFLPFLEQTNLELNRKGNEKSKWYKYCLNIFRFRDCLEMGYFNGGIFELYVKKIIGKVSEIIFERSTYLYKKNSIFFLHFPSDLKTIFLMDFIDFRLQIIL